MRDFAAKPAVSSKRLFSLVGVLALHGLLFWAIHTGLAGKFVKTVQQTVVQAVLIEEIKTSIPPPPPPPPPLPPQVKPSTPPKDAPATVPQPTPTASAPTTPAAITATATATPSPAPTAPSVPSAPAAPTPTPPASNPLEGVRTAISLVGSCAKPAYPEASWRNEEEGTTVISLTVASNNTVQSASVVKSSGFPRLDEIARAAFVRCQYRAATVGGSPVTSSRQIPFVWSLDE